MNNKNLIIALIIVIAVLIVALAGTIAYIAINKDNNPKNTPIIVDNDRLNENKTNQNELKNENSENTTINNVENNNNVVNNTDVNNTTNTEAPNNTSEPQDNTIQPTQPPEEDMTKLLFNSDIIAYLGEITGEQVQQLINTIIESNNKNANHQITISSNSIGGPNEIVSTEKYVVTLSYDTEGYICLVNIDKKE